MDLGAATGLCKKWCYTPLSAHFRRRTRVAGATGTEDRERLEDLVADLEFDTAALLTVGMCEVVVVDPVKIDVDRKQAVTITWEDGHVSRFPLEVLRSNCLCAQCRARRDQGGAAWAPTGGGGALHVESATQVGNWGLNLHWSDGHTTGIFTWEVLRAWCRCERCSGD